MNFPHSFWSSLVFVELAEAAPAYCSHPKSTVQIKVHYSWSAKKLVCTRESSRNWVPQFSLKCPWCQALISVSGSSWGSLHFLMLVIQWEMQTNIGEFITGVPMSMMEKWRAPQQLSREPVQLVGQVKGHLSERPLSGFSQFPSWPIMQKVRSDGGKGSWWLRMGGSFRSEPCIPKGREFAWSSYALARSQWSLCQRWLDGWPSLTP